MPRRIRLNGECPIAITLPDITISRRRPICVFVIPEYVCLTIPIEVTKRGCITKVAGVLVSKIIGYGERPISIAHPKDTIPLGRPICILPIP